MPTDLSLVTTEELTDELRKRFDVCIIAGQQIRRTGKRHADDEREAVEQSAFLHSYVGTPMEVVGLLRLAEMKILLPVMARLWEEEGGDEVEDDA